MVLNRSDGKHGHSNGVCTNSFHELLYNFYHHILSLTAPSAQFLFSLLRWYILIPLQPHRHFQMFQSCCHRLEDHPFLRVLLIRIFPGHCRVVRALLVFINIFCKLYHSVCSTVHIEQMRASFVSVFCQLGELLRVCSIYLHM